MATVTDLGACSGCCQAMVTVTCNADAVEVPEDLEVEFSGATGTLSCLNGLIYDLYWDGTAGWRNPPFTDVPNKFCLCVDEYQHYMTFNKSCGVSPSPEVPLFNFSIVFPSQSGAPSCGGTGPQVLIGDPGLTANYTGNGDTFVWTGTVVHSAGPDTLNVTVRKR